MFYETVGGMDEVQNPDSTYAERRRFREGSTALRELEQEISATMNDFKARDIAWVEAE